MYVLAGGVFELVVGAAFEAADTAELYCEGVIRAGCCCGCCSWLGWAWEPGGDQYCGSISEG